MIDPHIVLDIPPGSNLEKIREAYYQKRALVLSLENNPTIPDQLKELEAAYEQLSNKYLPAIPQESWGEEYEDPVLKLVDRMDAPINIKPVSLAKKICPNCNTSNPFNATICQACGFQMTKTCPNCGALVPRDTLDCPRCGIVIGEFNQKRLAEAEVIKDRLVREKSENDMYVNALEAKHTERRKFGVLFWAIVIIVLVALCGFAIFSETLLNMLFSQ